MKSVRARVRVRGVVQGVNFRYSTLCSARTHQVTGWVRNLPDGDVEAVFEGREVEVRAMLEWCRSGPSAARVDELLIDWEEYRGEFESFEIHR